MRIVLVISSLNAGGAERVLSQLANYWVLKGHEVTLVTFKREKNFYDLSTKIVCIQPDNVEPISSFFMRLKNIFGRIFYLKKIIKAIRPHVIISFVDMTNLIVLLASKRFNTSVIVCERTNCHYHRIPLLYEKIRPLLYLSARKIIVQTNHAASYFKGKLRALIQVIPNPVLEVNNKKIYSKKIQSIITLGRLSKEKDHKTLIQAFARICQYHPDLYLTIYGEGEERNNLQALIHTLNLQEKVFLPGLISSVHDKLLKADLFVFPSLYEGFPNALCEAMSVGLPVIASNCSGNTDIIKDTINGRFFPTGDVSALASVMDELIHDFDQRQRLGQAAKNIHQQFHPHNIFKMWDDIIFKATENIF